ncbi:MAG TPA: hypothetical protein DCK98_11960 [Chloroflexi bacterium]|jgi:Domain of unknown function (DUF4349)|nr:hypothetical protein [Chloroflexota bacterium]HAL26451.1 hypothetical protein [Chloroflexota bacterium]
MKRLMWLGPAVLLLAACATSAGTASSGVGRGGLGVTTDAAAPNPAAVNGSAPQGSETGNGVPVPQALDPNRSVILTASIAMKAADPWAMADKAQAVATGLGGDVVGLNQSGSQDQRVASLTLRVPADRFTDALRQLRALDVEVVSSTVDGKDVTDQFVDLKARLAAKQSEEQRYLSLLTRATAIDDILKIDGALSNVRTQIEQLQGQVNSIASRTEFSTITVSISPSIVPVPTTTSAWDPAKTVAQAFATMTAMLHGFADVAIWMLVFGWIPLLALAIAVIATRSRRTLRTT